MSDAINPDHYNQGSIECIEAMKIVLTPEEFRGYLKGNVFKYLWREKDKNGNEDLRKGKSYYDRLIELVDEIDLLNPAERPKPTVEVTVEVTGEVKNPLGCPDGWRFLEVGEVIRKGDKYRDLKSQTWIEVVGAVGDSLQDFHKPTIRRNRFEVGEKVIYIPDQSVWTYVSEINDGPNHPKSAHVASGSTSLRACVTRLAPYIEETK